MPARVRATLFFKSALYGWTETFWRQNVDLGTILTSAVQDMAPLRMKISGTGTTLTHVRVSDDDVRRDSLVTQLNMNAVETVIAKPPPSTGSAGDVIPVDNTPSDQPYSAILLRMESGALYRRSMYLRGCPDDVIVNPPGPTDKQGWAGAFNKWRDYIRSGIWYFPVIDRDPPNGDKKVSAVSLPAGRDFTLTVPAHGYAQGDVVRVITRRYPGFAGVRPIKTRIDADNVVITMDTTEPIVYTGGMVLLKNITKLAAINDVVLRGETHRSTGSPSDRPRGRRPNRARKSL